MLNSDGSLSIILKLIVIHTWLSHVECADSLCAWKHYTGVENALDRYEMSKYHNNTENPVGDKHALLCPNP